MAALEPRYAVFLFPSVSYVLKAEKRLKEQGIAHKLIPVPREIGSDCGICIRVAVGLQEATEAALTNYVEWVKTALL